LSYCGGDADYRWSADKDAWLRAERGIGFEELVQAAESGSLLDDRDHPGPQRTHQRLLLVGYQGQVCLLPYVQAVDRRFLKTACPGRKATKHFGYGGWDEKKA
jgi:hypothetical protein